MKKVKNNNKKPKRVFSKEHYNSDNGMLTSIWGPPIWHFLHTTSFNYPIKPTKADKIHYKNFILNMGYVLPCGSCRDNFNNNLKDLPLRMSDMKNRETFSLWVYKLHELVNKMLGKKSGLTYNDVRERYEHFRARCTESKSSIKKGKKSNKKKINRKHKNGCTSPMTGKKSQCLLKIVPHSKRNKSLSIDKKCIKKFKK